MQRIDLADELELEPADRLAVEGFAEDTLVRAALEALAREADVEPRWRVRIEKRIPVAAGLGGGSSDAAAALLAANATLDRPLGDERLHAIAAGVGADVPFFLAPGPKLAEGAGERLTPLDLPQDYVVVVALDPDAEKTSTAGVYARFDELGGGPGSPSGARPCSTLAAVRAPRDLAALPPNDLAPAAAPHPPRRELRDAGAFRADVSAPVPRSTGSSNDRGSGGPPPSRSRRGDAGLGRATRLVASPRVEPARDRARRGPDQPVAPGQPAAGRVPRRARRDAAHRHERDRLVLGRPRRGGRLRVLLPRRPHGSREWIRQLSWTAASPQTLPRARSVRRARRQRRRPRARSWPSPSSCSPIVLLGPDGGYADPVPWGVAKW